MPENRGHLRARSIKEALRTTTQTRYNTQMNALPFDTLKLAKGLEKTGWTPEQASEAARALADCMSSDMATKPDVTALENKMTTGFSILESKIATAIAGVETKIAAAETSAAKWIIGAVFVNSLTVLGGMIAIWQIAHK